jgi:hypothetical protein
MKDWIPLFQTIIQTGLPILFISFLVLLFWKKVQLVIDAVVQRIQAGAPLKAGSFELGAIPESVRSGKASIATDEGTKGAGTSEDIKTKLLNRNYPVEITDELYLVHATQEARPYRGPRTGWWHVRAYIEAYEDETLLDEIVRVTYRLHDTFSEKVIATEARDKAFELWISIYGEFNLIAYVERKGKPALWLTRYLDLPGRPTN